jgi:hypothetical protein
MFLFRRLRYYCYNILVYIFLYTFCKQNSTSFFTKLNGIIPNTNHSFMYDNYYTLYLGIQFQIFSFTNISFVL